MSIPEYSALWTKALAVSKTILNQIVEYAQDQKAVLIYDQQSPLADLLGRAYASHLSSAEVLVFDAQDPSPCVQALEALGQGDLAVLVQSSSFRLSEFRIRMELFGRGVKVVEHPHLGPIEESQWEIYLDCLEYDPEYYRGVGNGLKQWIDSASHGRICSPGHELLVSGPFEDAKLNVGEFSGRKNIGGQFPIGEVITEALELEQMNGSVRIFAYGDAQFRVKFPTESLVLHIEKGQVVKADGASAEFEQILEDIRAEEGVVWVREIGLGLNRALTKTRILSGIGSYERMCGVHLSLGAKHHIYPKAHLNKRKNKYHVDVFVDAQSVYFGEQCVFSPGSWLGAEILFPEPAEH